MRVHVVIQLSDPRKKIGVLGVNFYCGRGDSPMGCPFFPGVMAEFSPCSARRPSALAPSTGYLCTSACAAPPSVRALPRCLARRSSATFDVGTSRWPSSRPPAGSSQGGAEPIGVLCGAVLRFQRGGAFAVGHGTTAGVLEHLAELRVEVLRGRERCCCPRHQLAPVSGPCAQCVSFRAPERSGSRHSII